MCKVVKEFLQIFPQLPGCGQCLRYRNARQTSNVPPLVVALPQSTRNCVKGLSADVYVAALFEPGVPRNTDACEVGNLVAAEAGDPAAAARLESNVFRSQLATARIEKPAEFPLLTRRFPVDRFGGLPHRMGDGTEDQAMGERGIEEFAKPRTPSDVYRAKGRPARLVGQRCKVDRKPLCSECFRDVL